MFEESGVNLQQPITATCYIGHTACVLALAAAVCGKNDAAVYAVSVLSDFKYLPVTDLWDSPMHKTILDFMGVFRKNWQNIGLAIL